MANAFGGDGADIGAFEARVLTPTAASVSIGGRVLTPDGRSLINARVILTDRHGMPRTVSTMTFGYFHFAEVSAGESEIITVVSKRYSFAAQFLNVTENATEMSFIAQPSKRLP